MEKLHLSELRNASKQNDTHTRTHTVTHAQWEQTYGKHLLNANIYGHKHVLVSWYVCIYFWYFLHSLFDTF